MIGIIKFRTRVNTRLKKNDNDNKAPVEDENEDSDDQLDVEINKTMHKELKDLRKGKEKLLTKVSR